VSGREQLRRTFDDDAELYDRARPGYPDALVDDLVALTGLQPGDRVIEIGSGTGQLTVPLARRSLRITGLELGPGLATIARRNLERFETVEIVTGAFEAWDPGDQRFDAVIAATRSARAGTSSASRCGATSGSSRTPRTSTSSCSGRTPVTPR
jgi:protein-L-isoaspartate O-methyltransferase